jgi:hypothetical protein
MIVIFITVFTGLVASVWHRVRFRVRLPKSQYAHDVCLPTVCNAMFFRIFKILSDLTTTLISLLSCQELRREKE